jgi:predicted CXXCH cytochrome family protein
MRRALFFANPATVLGAFFWFSAAAAQSEFPHQTHSVFFSECGACHSGVTTGAWEGVYPETSTCTACHDGSTAPNIDWTPPDEPRASNLAFRHDVHAFECATCHVPGGGEDLALLAMPAPAICLGCHAPQAEGHLEAQGQCQTCHVPVVESRLSEDAIRTFPHPASHDAGRFEITHGPGALASPSDCAVCHDRTGCFTCHAERSHLQEAILQIPLPRDGGPRGVPLPERKVPPFHEGNFSVAHAAAASAKQPDCAVCHSESTCNSCHEGQNAPAFHPVNFLASHGPEAYGRVSDCSSCHNPEAFCRTCHLGLGLDAGDGIGGAYHNDQTLWILSHAPAARQDLESCVSCHQQTDCLRCHSAQSGLGINPHGPDFDGSRISDRNKAMCTLCHISGG